MAQDRNDSDCCDRNISRERTTPDIKARQCSLATPPGRLLSGWGGTSRSGQTSELETPSPDSDSVLRPQEAWATAPRWAHWLSPRRPCCLQAHLARRSCSKRGGPAAPGPGGGSRRASSPFPTVTCVGREEKRRIPGPATVNYAPQRSRRRRRRRSPGLRLRGARRAVGGGPLCTAPTPSDSRPD